MAPNFLSMFTKNTPSHANSNLGTQGTPSSRSASPSFSSRNPPPFINIDPNASTSNNSARPRRHTTVGNLTPSLVGSTESFPNVTVVPPSPHTTQFGSDTPDEHLTPQSARSPNAISHEDQSARRVPSLSKLGAPAPSPRSVSSATDDEGGTTPTPATTRTAFSEQAQVKAQAQALSHFHSTGNLRAKSSAMAPNETTNHPRSATMADQRSLTSSEESSQRTPGKNSSKDKSRSASRKSSSAKSRHDRAASVPSIPTHPPNATVTEDGVLTFSPTSDSPQTSMSAQLGSGLPGTDRVLLVPDPSDAVSTNSSNNPSKNPKKKRSWTRGGRTTNIASSPAPSTVSFSPTRKSAGKLPPTSGTGSSFVSPRARRASDLRSDGSRMTSAGYAASDASDRESYHSGTDLLEEQSGLDDEDDLDLSAEDIPVTGFAVASNKRNQDFHELFPTVPEGDYLIEDYGCALQREILIQGRIYVSENHLCFHANIFGWITDLCIPMCEVTSLDKRMTAFVIPNAIQVTTTTAKYTFASFLSRDTTFDVIYNVWKLARPEVSSSVNSQMQSPRASTEVQRESVVVPNGKALVSIASIGEKGGGKQKVTQCACSKSGEHYKELAMEAIIPGTPEKVYNLMFTSGFIKDFMVQEQKLTDLQISDWMPTAADPKLLYRQMSYIKPLNGGIGPKQTKCELRDEMLHCDFDDYVSMLTTTRTPDVPSGGVFSVKTRTCITWASNISTKVVVTTEVEWTGRSFIKGLIEKSAIEGQKQYHTDLDNCMRQYIHDHRSEFIPDGVDVSVVEEVETPPAETPPRPILEKSAPSEQELRESRTLRSLQWAYDTYEGAVKVTKQSTEGLLDLLMETWDQSTTTNVLYFIIVFLVISNIWTLVIVGRREEAGRRKEMKRTEEREKWVQNVVTALWDELVATRSPPEAALSSEPRPISDWREDVDEINAVLDQIDARVQKIRASIAELD
ncbi:uncharacterized protein LAESUDRAFT_493035 [Laetiporus sulphureus 93-53]|uniref:VASt domain-containing protein n=1 Tax=Laetiporus sulphureus 93-53 TaxID=1314785 RepID=A0A165BJ42_9APHY|nr:uncharacterized protein LAESUDRAFT_493035 [Laetiporus sulphureus 93-53]KZT01154.1 hypothetical protein LAESUDRAFT_493035 [Laetiporus sulphureus 93-53]